MPRSSIAARGFRGGSLASCWSPGRSGRYGLALLDRPLEEEAPLRSALLAPFGIALYAFASCRYLRLFRARQRMLPLSVAVAFLLLAEALIAVAFARSWHASWWEWHVLMAIAFAIAIPFAAQRIPARGFGHRRLRRDVPGADARAHRPALVRRSRS